ncbi:MAG: nickel pincer cofactor biosynthesis protein LarC [Nocardioidaceae bacterium]
MIGWLDAASGASGDMLLGALVGAGADLAAMREAVAAVAPERVVMSSEPVRRGSLSARRVVVEVADSGSRRGLGDVLGLIGAAAIATATKEHATAVFTAFAESEASVHGTTVDEVHFHEVGALDAIADIVGACAGFLSLDLGALHCSPVAVGSGSVSSTHGMLSVPVPAVVALLRGVPTYAGPVATELCTPTGAALLAHWVTSWGPQPAMAVSAVGVGAGGADFASHANVLRLLVGEASSGTRPASPASPEPDGTLVIETNVDDLDPRLWPRILTLLLDRGASDAWLTPILMKKGRPAHTLSVLARSDRAESLRTAIYAETSAIGMREYVVSKRELDREFRIVAVGGRHVRVKVALWGGAVVNVQPEYDDVVVAADALGRPAKSVLAEAAARARRGFVCGPEGVSRGRSTDESEDGGWRLAEGAALEDG